MTLPAFFELLVSDDGIFPPTTSSVPFPSWGPNRKPIQLLTSPQTSKAFCWQFHCPYIILPETMQTFPAQELQGVVRHEKAHLKAGHPLHFFLQRIVEILFWFHPLVWWASRQAAWSREFHCDAAAVATAREAASYLRGLLRITEQRMGAGLGLPAGLNLRMRRSVLLENAFLGPNRDDADECEFDSRHAGYANFLWADGHVDCVVDAIDT